MMFESDNAYLKGNFAPWREEGDAYDLEIEGALPAELNGALYRIGPNPHFKPAGRYHWFDGDGMVHAFLLRNGRAVYRNRYVRTAGLAAELRAGRALYGGLLEQTGELPPDAPQLKNVANTNIIAFADRLLALWEAGLPHELKPETLETVSLFDFGGALNGPVTAHPKFDPDNGDLLFFGYQPMPPYVTYYRAERSGRLLERREIDTGLPVMMHDFVTTRNHAIFFVCPSVFRIENLGSGKPLFNWEPQHGTRIGVLDRRNASAVQWFEDEACYIFHFLNAYEDGGALVIDACRLDHLDMSGSSFGGALPYPTRYRLELGSGIARREQTDQQAGEFPRINDALAGYRHRYGYLCGISDDPGANADSFSVLLKRDYAAGRFEIQDLGPRMSPGEPIFVPRANSKSEDDGWVLAVWYDEKQNRSELCVLDGARFCAPPVARVKLGHRVPFGFHGNWVPAARIGGGQNAG